MYYVIKKTLGIKNRKMERFGSYDKILTNCIIPRDIIFRLYP